MTIISRVWSGDLTGFRERLDEVSFTEQESVDMVASTVTTNIISLSILVGTVAVPAIAGIMTGAAIVILIGERWPFWLSLTLAFTTGIGIEAVGMVVGHVLLKLYRGWREKKVLGEEVIIVAILLVLYAVAVDIIIAFADADKLPETLKVIGMGSPWLAVILYIARGLYLDVRFREVKDKLDREAAEHRRQEEELRQAASELANRQQQQEAARDQRDLERDAMFFRLETQREAALLRTNLKYGNGHKTNGNGHSPLTELAGQMTESVAEVTEDNRPEWLPRIPVNKADWEAMLQDGMVVPPHIKAPELARILGRDERTVRRWPR